MYLKHYGLKLKPFEISPDPKFLWLGSQHQETLASLERGILGNKGLMLLTGDPGTGKTLLLNALSNRLRNDITFAQVFDPSLEELDFFNMTANTFEVGKKVGTIGVSRFQFNHSLKNSDNKDKNVVLIIEEAQRINIKILEQIRYFSDTVVPKKRLITIILVGQNEFINTLKEDECFGRQVNFFHNLKPLLNFEIEKYISHRLHVAGSRKKIFRSSAISEIYALSEGIPYLINNICDFALLAGYKSNKDIITPDTIRKGIAIFQSPNKLSKAKPTGTTVSKKEINILTPKTIKKSDLRLQFQNIKINKLFPILNPNISYLPFAGLIGLLFIFGYLFFPAGYGVPLKKFQNYAEIVIAHLADSKPETLAYQSDNTAFQQLDLAESKVKPQKIKTLFVSEIVQLGQLNDRNEKLGVAIKELTPSKNRITKIMSKSVEPGHLYTQAVQAVEERPKDKNRENKDQKHPHEEISSTVFSTDELQKKEEPIQSKILEAETNLKNDVKKSDDLHDYPRTNIGEKLSVETLVKQLKARNDEHGNALQELKITKEQVTALEKKLANQEKLIFQTRQELNELTKELKKEIKDKGLVQAEPSSRADLITEQNEKQDEHQPKTLTVEAEIEKREHNDADLGVQANNSNKKISTPKSSLKNIEGADELQSENGSLETENEPPDPHDIIDWVINKHSK